MSAPLLHMVTTSDWRAALDLRVVAPPSLAEVGFVHLSTAEQVVIPANRLFPGRTDVSLLVLDPDRIGVPVRWEPGLDAPDVLFPHAYGPVPTAAVLAVLPYRPRADGRFDVPGVPATDAAARLRVLQTSVLRRTATTEVPVTGGVAVLTAPVPLSRMHNQLLVTGETDAATLAAEADHVLGGAAHRTASLHGAGLADTAAGLAALGWKVDDLVAMAAPAGGPATGRVEQVGVDGVRAHWDATWLREFPAIEADAVAQLTDRYRLEERVTDLRCLAVRDDGEVVAAALLKIDGATAFVDMVGTAPAHRGRGYGNLLLAEALAVAGRQGCDLVTLEAEADDWPRRWYAGLGFAEVAQAWSATFLPPEGTSHRAAAKSPSPGAHLPDRRVCAPTP